MKRLLPVILLVTVLPSVVLVSAAFYIGNQYLVTRSDPEDLVVDNTYPSGNTILDQTQDDRKSNQEQTANTQSSVTQSAGDEDSWVMLFNGKNLNGWEGNQKFFRVEDKSIVAGNLQSKIPRNEFLCTKKEYQDFELKLQAKLIGKGENAGIQFRSRRIKDHHEMIGFQCDMGTMNKRSIWGSLYDESRRRKFLAEGAQEETLKKTKQNDWNDLRIRCEGNRIQIWLNGFKTVDYVEKDSSIAVKGVIGLQIHSGPPSEAWYRNVMIRQLGTAE